MVSNSTILKYHYQTIKTIYHTATQHTKTIKIIKKFKKWQNGNQIYFSNHIQNH